MSKEMASFLKISELTKSITSLDAAGGGEKKKKTRNTHTGFYSFTQTKTARHSHTNIQDRRAPCSSVSHYSGYNVALVVPLELFWVKHEFFIEALKFLFCF